MLDDQDIEQLLLAQGLKTTPELDARILGATQNALDRSTHRSMRYAFAHRAVKHLGIAAGILLVIGAAIYLLVQREVSAAEMLHRVAVSTGGYDGWIHLKGQAIVTEPSRCQGTFSSYIHPADGTEATIDERNGKRFVRLYIPSRLERFEYDSGSNEIWIGAALPNSHQAPSPDGEPTFLWFLDLLQRAHKSNRISATRTRENGLDRYTLVYPPELLHSPQLLQDVWVQPASQRILKTSSQSFTLDWTYGERAINDIYDLDVPRDAKVVDTRPQAHEAKIAAQFDLDALRWELKRRFDTGFGDHTALVLQSHVEADGSLLPWFVHVLRKRGLYERCDDLYVGHNQEISKLRQYVEKNWPKVTFAEAFELETKGPVEERIISTPTQSFISNTFLGGGIRELQAGLDLGQQMSMVKLTWNYRQIFEPYHGNQEKVDWTLLPVGSRAEKWIGVQAVRIGKDMESRSTQKIEEYWYDPLKGYVLLEHSAQYDDNPENVFISTRRTTLKTAQTPSGVYYPAHIRETLKMRTAPNHKQEFIDNVREEHIIVETNLIPAEALFAADQASIKQLVTTSPGR